MWPGHRFDRRRTLAGRGIARRHLARPHSTTHRPGFDSSSCWQEWQAGRLTRALQRSAALLHSWTVGIICQRLLQPAGRFRRRLLRMFVRGRPRIPGMKDDKSTFAPIPALTGLSIALLAAWTINCCPSFPFWPAFSVAIAAMLIDGSVADP